MLFTALCLTSAVTTLIVVLAVFVVLLAVFFALVPVGTWFRALVSGSSSFFLLSFFSCVLSRLKIANCS